MSTLDEYTIRTGKEPTRYYSDRLHRLRLISLLGRQKNNSKIKQTDKFCQHN